MKITEAQVFAACQIAESVFDGEIKAAQGITVLVAAHGLNKATASDFINDYKHLLDGTVFKRAMSAFAMRHFMEQIFAERGEQHRNNSVVALRAHITYYEGHYKTKTTMSSMRAVADDFDALRQNPKTDKELATTFADAVERSTQSTRDQRLKRLASARKRPASFSVQSTVFSRNPDAVVETLFRAQGKCEACASKAPFLRAKDATPYLEVHHRIQLSADGEDTVENAIALCPNCHRKSHYGVVDP